MKRILFTFIGLLITVSCMAQIDQHNLPVRMLSVQSGTVTDDVIVRDPATGDIKYVTQASIGGGGGAVAGLYNEAFAFSYGSGTISPAASGTIRFNNALPQNATQLYISKLNTNSADVRNLVGLITNGSAIYIQKKEGPNDFIVYTVNGNPINNSGNYTIPVTADNNLGSLVVADDLIFSVMINTATTVELDPIHGAWLVNPQHQADLIMSAWQIKGLADGTDPSDAITKQQLDAIDGTTAIGRYDEGNGDTFYPVGYDRTFTGIGGAGALDLGFYDGAGSQSPTQGSLGTQSFSMGYNNKNEGYGAFMLGQDSDIPTSGTYAINIGTDNSIGGYSGVGLGTFLTNTTNYGIQIGHSIDFTQGGLNVGIGWGLSETTANSDKVAIFGQGNKEPINSEGFASNNIGMIVGSGDLTGDGSAKFVRVTPRNSMVFFRDALAGLVNLEESTLANLKVWDDTYPHAAATVEYVQDAVSSGTSDVSIVKFTDTQDVTDNLITMNGNGFLHNYGNTALVWEKNLFLGENAGNFTMTSNTNGFFGNDAGYSITTGAENYGFGNETLASVTTGGMNTAFGSASGYAMVDGVRNSFFGRQSGVWLTTGDNNTFFGSTSGFSQGSGGNLTAIDNATLIGSFADGTEGSTNETAIGFQAIGSGSNTVTLGNSSITAIKAGVDYTASDGRDLITKGYADATYLGGGGIGGTIADNQVAIGNGTDAIDGSASLTYDGTLLVLDDSNSIRFGSNAFVDFANSDIRLGGLATTTGVFLSSGTNSQITLSSPNTDVLGNLNIEPATGNAQINLNPDLGQGTINILQTGDYDMKFELLGTGDYSFYAGAQERLNISDLGLMTATDSDVAGNGTVMTWGNANHMFDAIQDYTRNQHDAKWTLGLGWSDGDDVLTASAASGDADLNLSPAFLVGDIVKIIINVSSYSLGSLTISVEGSSSAVVIDDVGKYELVIDPLTTTHNDLKITTTTDFTGTISQFKAIGYQANESLVGGDGIQSLALGGFNNPLNISNSSGPIATISYNRNIPAVTGSTARTPTVDNWQGAMFINNTANSQAITIDGNDSQGLGYTFSVLLTGTGNTVITPTNGATINGVASAVTVTTKYSAVQFINVGGDDYVWVGKL